MSFDWLEVAKRLDAIARTGLAFSSDTYDRERYREICDISQKIFLGHTDTTTEKISGLFEGDLGYPTPKVDIRGVVFNENSILLVREKLDNRWSVPGGWADIGFTPAEVVKKEIREESGLEVEPDRLLAVLDKKKHDHPPSALHVYKIFILCRKTGGKPQAGIETSGVGFFPVDRLPKLSMERVTPGQIRMLYKLYRDPSVNPPFD